MNIVICPICHSNWNKDLYENCCPICEYINKKEKRKNKKEKIEKSLTELQKMNLEYLRKYSPNYKISDS